MVAASPETPYFAAYAGPSMHPTLREPEMLEIRPCGTRPPRAGDVVFIEPSRAGQPTGQATVHRIVRVTAAGLVTRGDNNCREDDSLAQPADIRGRVVAAWRGPRRRVIAGGIRGRLAWCCVRWRRALDRGISPLLRPAYRALCGRGGIARLLPARLRPRVVAFRAHDRDLLHLLLGRRVIGRYDERRGEWRIQRPFRVFAAPSRLPPGAPPSERGK